METEARGPGEEGLNRGLGALRPRTELTRAAPSAAPGTPVLLGPEAGALGAGSRKPVSARSLRTLCSIWGSS